MVIKKTKVAVKTGFGGRRRLMMTVAVRAIRAILLVSVKEANCLPVLKRTNRIKTQALKPSKPEVVKRWRG